MFSILICQMTGVLWYKWHDLVSGDTSALIAHTGTRQKVQEHGVLGRERSHGDTRAGAVDALEPGEPLTCGLLPLLIEKVCRAYGGAGGEPLQPCPGFKLDRKKRQSQTPRTTEERREWVCSLWLSTSHVTPSQGLELGVFCKDCGWGSTPHHCQCDQYEGSQNSRSALSYSLEMSTPT